MLLSEFKEKTGLIPTEDEYFAIESIYICHKSFKDDFCKQWMIIPESMRCAITESIMCISKEATCSKDDIRKKIADYEDYRNFVKDIAITLLHNDPDDEVAYKLVDLKEIVLYKASNRIDMNDRDVECLKDLMKA